MGRAEDIEVDDLLQEVRRLKSWLIGAALLLTALVVYVGMLSKTASENASELRVQADRVSQIKAAYENQKKELYQLDVHTKESEIDFTSRLRNLEENDE